MSRVWPWVSFLGSVLFIGWTAKSFVGYHTFSLEEAMEDIKQAPLPLNDVGLNWFKNTLLVRSYGEGKDNTQMHMKITLFLAIALFLQLWKRTRGLGGKGKPFHTWLGRISILVALGSIPHFTRLVFNFPHRTTAYAELPVIFMIPFFGIKGWSEIRNGDWRSHRASMIMFSACFYYFGVQRLMISLIGVIHHEKSPFAKHLPLGPWSQWNEDDYNEMFGIGICAAFVVTFSVATYNAYIGPNSKAAADSKAVQKQKQK